MGGCGRQHPNRDCGLLDLSETLQGEVVSTRFLLAQLIERRIKSIQRDAKQLGDSMNKVERNADEYGQQLNKLEPSRVSPVEFLFLQSFASEQRKSATDLNEILAELEVTIGENQEKLGDFKDEIVNIKSLLDLSTPTKVRSPAILPDRPFKPHKFKSSKLNKHRA